MAARVSHNGRVTIPKPVRDRLGIVRDDIVEFELTADGRVVLAKVGGKPQASPFEALRGRAGVGMSTDEIMALTRGEG